LEKEQVLEMKQFLKLEQTVLGNGTVNYKLIAVSLSPALSLSLSLFFYLSETLAQNKTLAHTLV